MQDMTRIPADWPLELVVVGRDVRRGRNLKFHGTQRQLVRYLAQMNSVGSGGHWDVDRTQIPEGVDLPKRRRRKIR